MSLTLNQINMYHCIKSANENLLIRATIPGTNKETCFKMDPQTGQHLKHNGKHFLPISDYQKAMKAWKQKETPLPERFKKYAEAIIDTYKESAPVVKKKKTELVTE